MTSHRIEEEEFFRSMVDKMGSVLRSGTQVPTSTGRVPLHHAMEVIAHEIGTILPDVDVDIDDNAGMQRTDEALAHLAGAASLDFRRVRLEDNWWNNITAPMIVFIGDDKKPSAIIGEGKSAVLVDEAGKTTPLTAGIAEMAGAEGYIFYPTLPQKIEGLKNLLFFTLKQMRRDFKLIMILGIVSSIVGLGMPIATRVLFDVVIPDLQEGLFYQVIFLLLAGTIGIGAFQLVRGFASLRMAGIVENRLQAALWSRLLRLPATFFSKFSTGDLIQRVTVVNRTRKMITGQVISVLMNAFFGVIYLMPMTYYSWKLSAVGIGFMLILLALNATIVLLKVPIVRRMLEVGAQIHGFLVQIITGIPKLRIANAEKKVFARWANKFTEQQGLSMKMATLDIISGVAGSIVPVVASIGVFYIASNSLIITPGQAGQQVMTVGQYLAFQAAYAPFAAAIGGMLSTLVSLVMVGPLWERARVITDEEPEGQLSGKQGPDLEGAVKVDKLWFQYPTTTSSVLEEVSLSCKAGEFIGIVGESGSGKSTLLKILLGLLQPTSGTVYYDQADAAFLQGTALRQQVGSVLQTTRVFGGTVRENVLMGRTCSEEDLKRALYISCFDEVLETLPMGLETLMQSGGTSLSGGQRQRLLIARALVGNPKVLIFDEATASLDANTQDWVMRRLDASPITRIVVAHRLSTIERADKIFVLHNGRIAETGTYSELLAKKGLFSKMAAPEGEN